MLKAGEILDFRPLMPIEMKVVIAAADTRGARSVMEVRIGAGAPGPPLHQHPQQDEYYDLLAGELRLTAGGRKIALGAGERLTVPRGTAHYFRNRGPREAVFLSEHRPALRFEEFMSAICGLAQSGEFRSVKSPGFILRMAVILQAFADVQQQPTPLRRYGLRWLAAAGRRGARASIQTPPGGDPLR